MAVGECSCPEKALNFARISAKSGSRDFLKNYVSAMKVGEKKVHRDVMVECISCTGAV